MTVPSDFGSCFVSAELTNAKYSGGAGGTFTNDISGGPALTVVSATPTFATKGARSGMVFANSATESILGQMYAQREFSVVAVLTTTSASAGLSAIGSANPTSFGWEMGLGATRKPYAWTPSLSSGVTGTAFGSDTPVVVACSWSPKNRKATCQWNLNTAVSATSGVSNAVPAMDYWDFGIGRNKNAYWTGWISHCSIYAQSLHDDKPTELTALITSLMATL
jgi:hypothetical protein